MPSLAEIAKMDTKDIDWGSMLGGLKLPGRGGERPRKPTGTVTGLDIQPGWISAVEADVNGVVSVRRCAGMALPADTVREGEVLDPGLLGETIKELFATTPIGRRVRVGLANQRTVVRIMDLPPIEDRRELQAAVEFQAQDQIPMPLASAVLDYHVLGMVDTPNGRRQRVVVVAAQRDLVSRLVDAVQRAGLKPVAVDLSAFAMIRALHRAAGEPVAPPAEGEQAIASGDGEQAIAPGEGEQEAQPAAQKRTLYLNVGGLTNVAIAEGVTCRFTRTVTGGLESIAAELAERHSIALTDARESLATVDLSASEQGEGLPADARAVLQAGVREIAGEVRNSLDFHRAQDGGGQVDDVVLSGAALEIEGFQRALENELGFSVTKRTVELSGGGSDERGDVPAQRLTIAAGLAVEEVSP